MIVFEKLPMPPSVNQAYRVVRFGKRAGLAKSVANKQYSIAFSNYILTNKHEVLEASRALQGKHFLSIESTFFFPKSRILTLNGMPKRVDVMNLGKIFYDHVAQMLDINDCFFWKVIENKSISSTDFPHVSIRIIPIEIMTEGDNG